MEESVQDYGQFQEKKSPKQFLQIFEKKSLFQYTVLRNKKLVSGYMLVTNENQLTIAIEQSKEIGVTIEKKIIESAGRNTALLPLL